jgi:acyl carrier protein phosphodiesterase
MNFLAHCLLSEPTSKSIVGNLLGDFCKGVDEKQLSAEVLKGLINHRAVDKFTDSHQLVIDAKGCFSSQRRRFAGIALDVLFDYYLIKHWHLYTRMPFDEFKHQTYQFIVNGLIYMPKPMANVMERVVRQDWFASYQSLEGIGHALDRIAGRVRFANHFSGAIDDIYVHDVALEHVFLKFFPQLQQHVQKIAN